MRAAVACVALALALGYTPDVRPHAATSNTVLFDREIVRILDEHCVMCHAERGPSFPLETYEETWLKRAAIHREVLAHRMPPWPAVPGYGTFANANALTLRETRFIVSWVEGLGPRNAGEVFLNAVAPAAATRAEVAASVDFAAWRLGEPDRTFALTAGEVGAAAPNAAPARWRRVITDLGLRTEQHVRALELKVTDASAIHAVALSVESTGHWLMTWTPWYGARELPDDVAFRLPAGARIVADVYGAPERAPPAELGRLGLHFAAGEAREPFDIVLEAQQGVPAGGERRRLTAEIVLAERAQALALWPELEGRIDSLEVSSRRADGTVDVLLFALDVTSAWPTPFVLAAPAELPAGSSLAVVAYASSLGERDADARVRLVVSAVR
jgi:hypothetical protein